MRGAHTENSTVYDCISLSHAKEFRRLTSVTKYKSLIFNDLYINYLCSTRFGSHGTTYQPVNRPKTPQNLPLFSHSFCL